MSASYNETIFTVSSDEPDPLEAIVRRGARVWKVDKKQISREERPTNDSDKQSLTSEQIRHCPDCGGSGMYYPDGFDKGVAKCRHERLKSEGNPTPKA